MCNEKNNGPYRDWLQSCTQYPQFSIYWIELDKVRPAIIISNTWFNIVSRRAWVLPITSTVKEPDDTKEYTKLYFKFININKELNMIDMSSAEFIPLSEIKPKNFIGMVVDPDLKDKLIEMSMNITNPNFNMDSFSYSCQEGIKPVYDEPCSDKSESDKTLKSSSATQCDGFISEEDFVHLCFTKGARGNIRWMNITQYIRDGEYILDSLNLSSLIYLCSSAISYTAEMNDWTMEQVYDYREKIYNKVRPVVSYRIRDVISRYINADVKPSSFAKFCESELLKKEK